MFYEKNDFLSICQLRITNMGANLFSGPFLDDDDAIDLILNQIGVSIKTVSRTLQRKATWVDEKFN